MQYLLTEDELRALKAESDVKIQANILAEDYRIRLSKRVLDEMKPYFLNHPYHEPHHIIERLRAVFQSVPVVVDEKKV